jgi:uncharacterized protein HemY
MTKKRPDKQAQRWEPPPRAQESHTPHHVERSEREVLGEAHYKRAQEHISLAEYHEAVQCLRDAVRFDPGKDHYHRLLGLTLLHNPLWKKQAEEQFRLALAANPIDSESCLELAKIYEESGLTSRAQAHYRKVLEIEGDNETARERLESLEHTQPLGRLKRLTQSLRDKLGGR